MSNISLTWIEQIQKDATRSEANRAAAVEVCHFLDVPNGPELAKRQEVLRNLLKNSYDASNVRKLSDEQAVEFRTRVHSMREIVWYTP